MNILFLTLLDFLSIEEHGIYTDLIREFIKNDHKIYVISPVEKRKLIPTNLIDNGNYKILKLQIGNIQKTNNIEKGISTIFIESQFKVAIKKYFKNVKFDLILYATPPITFAKVVNYIKERDGAKSYLLLKDIFPQNAVDLKMFSKKSLIYKYFRNKERKLYQLSDYIGCMSQANVDYLIENNHYLNKSKVHVSPNSIEPVGIIKHDLNRMKIREKYDVPKDAIIFLYGGNLGKPQGIDFFIDCLKTQIDNNRAYFMVVGSGTEYSKLEKYQSESIQKNFKVLPFLQKDEYDVVANSCDVGMIFLDKHFTIPNFPSRILAYMEASLPVFACTDLNTDIGQIIIDGKFGDWCESNDPDEFNRVIDKICSNPASLEKSGKNARRYLEDHYTSQHTYNIIMKKFK